MPAVCPRDFCFYKGIIRLNRTFVYLLAFEIFKLLTMFNQSFGLQLGDH